MKPCLDDPLIEDQALRARDGIVTGLRGARTVGRRQAGATWILVARADEPVEDFFLESPFGSQDHDEGEDPVAWICRSVQSDGTVRLGAVDLEVDRFVSEVLNDQLQDAIFQSIR
jgi:hypothetical protein